MLGTEDKTITLQDRQRSLTIDLVTEALAISQQDLDGVADDIDLLTDILVELDTAFPGLGPLKFTFSLDQRVRLVEIFRNEKAYIADGDVLYVDPQAARELLGELIELLNTPA